MTIEKQVDPGRRGLLVATCAVGGVAGVVTACSFVGSMEPSVRAKAGGASVEVDTSSMKPGEMHIVAWRGKPVWILNRTDAMLESLVGLNADMADPDSKLSWVMPVPEYCKNIYRSRPEHKAILVCVGICTHLGCSPVPRFQTGPQPSLPDNWAGGFLCPCHGSTYDLAGRIFKNKPAPFNLDIPPYMFLSDTKIIIGKDEKGEA